MWTPRPEQRDRQRGFAGSCAFHAETGFLATFNVGETDVLAALRTKSVRFKRHPLPDWVGWRYTGGRNTAEVQIRAFVGRFSNLCH